MFAVMGFSDRATSKDDQLRSRFLARPETLRWVRTAFDSVPIAMTLRGADQRLIWANRSYEQLIGQPLVALIGQPVSRVLENGREFGVEAMTGDESGVVKFEQLRYQRHDGTEFFADVSIQHLLDDDGESALLLAFVENVTDRVKLAKRQAFADFWSDATDRLSITSPANLQNTIADTIENLGRNLGAVHVVLADLQGGDEPLAITGWSAENDGDPACGRAVHLAVANAGRRIAMAGQSLSLDQPEALKIVALPLLGKDRHLVFAFESDQAVSDGDLQVLRDVAQTIGSTLERVEAQIYFKLAFDDAPVGISLRRMDSTLVAANQAYAQFLGYESPAEMVGAEAQRVLDVASTSAATAIPQQVAAAGHVQFDRVDFTRADGTKVTGRVHAKAVETTSGGEILILSHVEDLTASTKNERELEFSQRRFRDLVENSPAITMLATADLDITYTSPSIAQTGWSSDELVGYNFSQLPQSIVGNLVAEMKEVIESDQARFFDWAADGPAGRQFLHVSAVPEHNNDGEVVGIIMVAVDDTERRQSQAQLAHQASHDPLTGLANRTSLLEELTLQLVDDQSTPCLLFLDLDRFKVVNDSLGHAAGDELLRVVADRLLSAVRPDSTVARLGGDEFVIVVNGPIDLTEALAISQRIHKSLAPAIEIDEHMVYVTASIGIAFAQDDEPDTIMANADSAMYRAKDQGRNRTMVFDQQQQSFPTERIGIEADLRQALPRGEFEVYYQPEFDLHDGSLLGAEALVRWNHPDRGLLAAGQFIEIAEECGLISEIGDWVLAEACAVAERWQKDPLTASLIMRVNLSARQLSRSGAVDRVTELVSRNGADPTRLCLEITETALMADAASSLEVLEGLRRLGVSLAVDDFGTGYSSLAYLKRFPVQILKIDRSFVSGLPTDGNDLAIVASILSLADALGLEIVAEGVETEEQAKALIELGCRRAQGYLFGRPVRLDDFVSAHLAPAHLMS